MTSVSYLQAHVRQLSWDEAHMRYNAVCWLHVLCTVTRLKQRRLPLGQHSQPREAMQDACMQSPTALRRTCCVQSSWDDVKAGTSARGSFLRVSCSLGPRLRGALRCTTPAAPSLPEDSPELAGLAAHHMSHQTCSRVVLAVTLTCS